MVPFLLARRSGIAAGKCGPVKDIASQISRLHAMMLRRGKSEEIMVKSLLLLMLAFCTLTTPGIRPLAASSASAFQAGGAKAANNDISGMYTFLRDGEFVQITMDEGQVSGYVSRFGDADSDKGQFIDQFFDKASLQGDHLSFNTKTVHGIWYDFSGTVSTTPGRKPGEEGYRVLKGTLTQHATDAKGAEKAMQRQVDFKSFPADLSQP